MDDFAVVGYLAICIVSQRPSHAHRDRYPSGSFLEFWRWMTVRKKGIHMMPIAATAY
jgi:hypothetical protein